MAKSIFEEMGGTYRQEGDFLIPNLALRSEDAPRFGKYGRQRLSFLREHKKVYYTGLLLDGKLTAHLNAPGGRFRSDPYTHTWGGAYKYAEKATKQGKTIINLA